MQLIRQAIILIFLFSFVSNQNNVFPQNTLKRKDFVYVLHGLGRGKSAVKLLALRLEKAGFIAECIGYKSINETPQDILHNVTRLINSSLPDSSYTVHFVGHSFGGLMIRAYLESNHITNLGRLS